MPEASMILIGRIVSAVCHIAGTVHSGWSNVQDVMDGIEALLLETVSLETGHK